MAFGEGKMAFARLSTKDLAEVRVLKDLKDARARVAATKAGKPSKKESAAF
jgi:hypothetical protein